MGKIIRVEVHRNMRGVGIAAFIVFILVGCLIFQFGIAKYHMITKQQKEFVQAEKETVAYFINYMQYGTIGFRVMMKPSPLMAIFYNNTAFTDLVGIIDSAVRLRLEEPKQGQNAFSKPTGATLDLSWYFLIIGSLSVMAWAFFAFRNEEYTRYLMNFKKFWNVYLGITLARVLILAASLFILLIAILLQFFINSILLNSKEIVSLILFVSLLFLVLTFLMLLSSALGATRNIFKGGLAAALFWITAVMIWPEALNMVFSSRAERNIESINTNELKKLKIMNEFEKEALKNTQRYEKLEDKIVSDRKMAEYHWNNVFNKIESIDGEMIFNTENMAKEFHLLSILNPVTFLKSSNNELSSVGYKGYLELYRGNKERRRGFLRFIYDKRFYENYGTVVPYIPPDKTIIPVKNHLPYYFIDGFLLLLVYIFLAGAFSYYRLNKLLFPVTKNSFAGCGLDFQTGKHFRYIIDADGLFMNGILNLLWGQKGFDGKMTVNGTGIESEKTGFAYIPGPGKLPGHLKIKHIFNLMKTQPPEDLKRKKLFDLNGVEKFRALVHLARLKNCGVFVLVEYLEGINPDDIDGIGELIKMIKVDSFIIDFSRSCNAFIIPDSSEVVFLDGSKYVLKKV